MGLAHTRGDSELERGRSGRAGSWTVPAMARWVAVLWLHEHPPPTEQHESTRIWDRTAPAGRGLGMAAPLLGASRSFREEAGGWVSPGDEALLQVRVVDGRIHLPPSVGLTAPAPSRPAGERVSDWPSFKRLT